MRKILFIFFIIITLIGISNAKLIYVDIANGSDTNTGDTWNNAFASITAALDTATAGDTIYINQGIYEDYIANYNFSNWVYLVGIGKVKLWRRDLVGGQYNIYNSSYLNIENIEFVYDNTYNIYTYGIYFHFNFKNCIVPRIDIYQNSVWYYSYYLYAKNTIFSYIHSAGRNNLYFYIKNCDFINSINSNFGFYVAGYSYLRGEIKNCNFYGYQYAIYSDYYNQSTTGDVSYNNYDNCQYGVYPENYFNNLYPTTYKSDFIDTSYYLDGFLLKPSSPLFYSGEIVNGIPTHRGRGLLGIIDNYDSTQFTNWTDETGATIPVSNILVFDTTGDWISDSGITLKDGFDTGYLISPFYYFDKDSDVLKSINIDLLEEYRFISGQKQIIDADLSTPEREFEYSFNGSTWYITTSGKELNIPLQDKIKIKFRFLLRRDG